MLSPSLWLAPALPHPEVGGGVARKNQRTRLGQQSLCSSRRFEQQQPQMRPIAHPATPPYRVCFVSTLQGCGSVRGSCTACSSTCLTSARPAMSANLWHTLHTLSMALCAAAGSVRCCSCPVSPYASVAWHHHLSMHPLLHEAAVSLRALARLLKL